MRTEMMKISKKRVMMAMLCIVAGHALWAQNSQQYWWPNHIDTTANFLGKNVMVRYCESTYASPYRPYDVICGVGSDPTATYLDGESHWHTNFLIRKANDSGRPLNKVAVLPEEYRVKDMEVAWVRDMDGVKRPFCCFCGTMDSVYSYWTIGPSPNQPGTLVEGRESYAFVGAFSLTEAFGSGPVKVMLKLVREADSLNQMEVRTVAGGYWANDSSQYMDRMVMAAVGRLKNGRSCMAEVDLYPSVGGTPRWDYQIEAPTDLNEVLVDVANTDNYTFTLSRIDGASFNDKKMLLRSIRHSNGSIRAIEISPQNIVVSSESPTNRTLLYPMMLHSAGFDSVSLVFQTNDLMVMKIELPALLTSGTKIGVGNATMSSGALKSITYMNRNRKTVVLQGGALGDILLLLPKTYLDDGRTTILAPYFDWQDIVAVGPRYPGTAEYLTIGGARVPSQWHKISLFTRNTWAISRLAYWTMLGDEACHRSRTDHVKMMTTYAQTASGGVAVVVTSNESHNLSSFRMSDLIQQYVPVAVRHENYCEYSTNQ